MCNSLGRLGEAFVVNYYCQLVTENITVLNAVKPGKKIGFQLGFQLVEMLGILLRVVGKCVALDRCLCRKAHDKKQHEYEQEYSAADRLEPFNELLSGGHIRT